MLKLTEFICQRHETGTMMCVKTFLELSTIFRNTVVGTELRDVESVNSLANAGPSRQLDIRVAW